MPKFFCTFCNEKLEENHVSKCPKCGGSYHTSNSGTACVSCGYHTKLTVAKSEPVMEMAELIPEPVAVKSFSK